MTPMLAFDYTPLLTGIISFVFGGGLIAAIVALYKVKPEAGQIVVTAAQGALLVQTGVIENLKKEVQRLNDEVNGLKTKLEARDQLVLQLQAQIIQMQGDQNRHDREIKQHIKDYPSPDKNTP